MLRGHITGRMLGKATVSRPSPCVVRGRVRVKAAPQVAPHFGSTLVQDLIFNGETEALNLPESFYFMTEWSDKLNRGVDLGEQVLKTDILLKGKDMVDNLLDSYLRFKTPNFRLPDLDFHHIHLIALDRLQSTEQLNSHWGWDLVTGISNNLLSAVINQV